ncbi:MAG: hypothetical protein EBS73_13925 [Betaproteobacteria bacterium]|nr:hypothetical protein [Betaproteobacteria bacterium]NDE54482.1 hypothetical protein [Actinomycetota bacterium]NBS40340.1 hypothetical protein [Betaproteobacteria bacterium]NBT82799.1 hypothetical protein [Betaproteobacteria bacterium]NBY53923.1 hypothetical protein [Betaproteobacteria bacterium]
MKKLLEQWPYEFWPLEALGGLVIVGMLVYGILMIVKNIDDGILEAGYEHRTNGASHTPQDKVT